MAMSAPQNILNIGTAKECLASRKPAGSPYSSVIFVRLCVVTIVYGQSTQLCESAGKGSAYRHAASRQLHQGVFEDSVYNIPNDRIGCVHLGIAGVGASAPFGRITRPFRFVAVLHQSYRQCGHRADMHCCRKRVDDHQTNLHSGQQKTLSGIALPTDGFSPIYSGKVLMATRKSSTSEQDHREICASSRIALAIG